MGMDEKPVPHIPEDLDTMTPKQAWNAALDAIDAIIGWSSFWDDGRSIDTDEYRIKD